MVELIGYFLVINLSAAVFMFGSILIVWVILYTAVLIKEVFKHVVN